MTLRHTPLVLRLHERYRTHAGRLRLSSRLLWLWLRGRMGRRARGALRHQPARGRAKRPPIVASSESNMISPRRARDSQAASSSAAQASSAGAGASRPVGRLEWTSFFSHIADACAAHLHAGLAG
jgi:hypothetical protein